MEKTKRFTDDAVSYDSDLLPEETIIYYSKPSNLIQMTISIIIAIAGIIYLTVFNEQPIGFVLTCTGAYLGVKKYRRATNPAPQIILNNKGVQTASTSFYTWNQIKGIKTIRAGSYKYPKTYLTYKHPKGHEQFLVEDLNVNRRTLDKLLKFYHNSFKEAYKTSPNAHH
ncbi:hypothetical protein LJ707_07110 [Mucilaginibacter sp. UR6-1]|uniref:hypothetical protein n=1 Tax=Mucilaginibacter sp. UR6-1 TaxID=1435643 RepID=UPI001E6380FC|nr:hypothetical protein [Mucilaginibacter sp. UR6-1]MCC8408692.1 hypothetical protein [Mucilaginibacter sp. UR6-1]